MEIKDAFSPSFFEALRKHVEKDLNYEYSWASKGYIRKRDRGEYDAEFSQAELPYVTVTEVTNFEDFTYYGGYCDSCAYTETHCRVAYRTADGDYKEWEYDGSFNSLLESLIAE